MLKHIYNKLLQSPDISRHVYWVTVSQDFSIHKLQNKIIERIKLSLSNEEKELGHRAAEMTQELTKKQSVDDVNSLSYTKWEFLSH
uniref:NB-ARC domain-containing protein n=1 Tax=Salix viminalis TaxID=40686 RepID=A0A6N2KR36_SALVM